MPLALDEVWRNSILGCRDCQGNFPIGRVDAGVVLDRLGVGPAILVWAEAGFIKRTRSCAEFARRGVCVLLP
jgi:hypothetical protein